MQSVYINYPVQPTPQIVQMTTAQALPQAFQPVMYTTSPPVAPQPIMTLPVVDSNLLKNAVWAMPDGTRAVIDVNGVASFYTATGQVNTNYILSFGPNTMLFDLSNPFAHWFPVQVQSGSHCIWASNTGYTQTWTNATWTTAQVSAQNVFQHSQSMYSAHTQATDSVSQSCSRSRSNSISMHSVSPAHSPAPSPKRCSASPVRQPISKQELISQVQQEVLDMLEVTFPFSRADDTVTSFSNYTQEKIANLRGVHVLNVRTKSMNSLSKLPRFVQLMLECPMTTVKRVDVVLQTKVTAGQQTPQNKGLLLYLEFESKEEVRYVKDHIWTAHGFHKKNAIPKVFPAVFSSEISFAHHVDQHFKPYGFSWVEERDGFRVTRVTDPALYKQGLVAGTKITGMNVLTVRPNAKPSTSLIPKNLQAQILRQGLLGNTEQARSILDELEKPNTRLTIKFLEDRLKAFWDC